MALSTKHLEPSTKLFLEELLEKDRNDLTVDDVAFLDARRDYIPENDMDEIKESKAWSAYQETKQESVVVEEVTEKKEKKEKKAN